MSKRGLGKGLGALIQATTIPEEEVRDPSIEIPVTIIVPNKFQPRRVFDGEALADLSQSIKQYGVVQPVIVRKTLTGYELVAGERRWRAAQMAGLTVIPAVIREYTDGEMTEIALIENLQRENLNPIEEALAYKQLMEEFGLTQEELARKISKSRSHIANLVRLLNLPSPLQDYVSRGTLSVGQVRPILALNSEELQVEAADMIIEEDLSSRDAEELVKRMASTPRTKRQQSQFDNREYFLIEVEDRLKMLLGTQVRIKQGKLKGKIEIEFITGEDLERIIETLDSFNQQNKSYDRKDTLIV